MQVPAVPYGSVLQYGSYGSYPNAVLNEIIFDFYVLKISINSTAAMFHHFRLIVL